MGPRVPSYNCSKYILSGDEWIEFGCIKILIEDR